MLAILVLLLLLSSTSSYLRSPGQAVLSSGNQPGLPITGSGTGTGTSTGTITCHDTCGSISIKYPFGTGLGCGHPDFGRYVKCNAGRLQFSTSTGVYTVSSIDYPSETLIVSDPLMSTCNSMQNSGSFSLDSSAPFNVVKEDIFVLLGCSTTSPVFDPNEDLCDTGSASHVCKGLYSCKGVTGIGLEPNAPISTCCVYDGTTGLTSAYALDLPKLQCSSYSCIYGFGEDEGDPAKWNYGIALQFNDSYQTNACKDCEATGGLCGFNGLDEAFACVCRNGVNTTTNCYGQGWVVSTKLVLSSPFVVSLSGGVACNPPRGVAPDPLIGEIERDQGVGIAPTPRLCMEWNMETQDSKQNKYPRDFHLVDCILPLNCNEHQSGKEGEMKWHHIKQQTMASHNLNEGNGMREIYENMNFGIDGSDG